MILTEKLNVQLFALMQPNGRTRVMEKIFSKLGYKAFSWILPPLMREFNPDHSYTVSYVWHATGQRSVRG